MRTVPPDPSPVLYDLIEDAGVDAAASFRLVEDYRDLRYAVNPIDLPDGWTVLEDENGAAYPHVVQVLAWITSIDPDYEGGNPND